VHKYRATGRPGDGISFCGVSRVWVLSMELVYSHPADN